MYLKAVLTLPNSFSNDSFLKIHAVMLGCLYSIGSYDAFKSKIKRIAQVDRTNIRLAAVSSFVSQQLNWDDPYPFCKNPIDFLEYKS